MSEHLRECPIEVSRVTCAEAVRGVSLFAHLLGRDEDFEFDVEAAALAVFVRIQIRQRLRIALRTFESGRAEGRQSFHSYNPRRDRRGEALREERPQRLIFPALNVARRPVIDQTQTKDV